MPKSYENDSDQVGYAIQRTFCTDPSLDEQRQDGGDMLCHRNLGEKDTFTYLPYEFIESPWIHIRNVDFFLLLERTMKHGMEHRGSGTQMGFAG